MTTALPDQPGALVATVAPMPGNATVWATALMDGGEVYRYRLTRTWAQDGDVVAWVMLNPSTADATEDDATVRKCARYARAWGAGGMVVLNLFALRSRHPNLLARHPDPVGPHNDAVLIASLALAQPRLVVAGWGVHGGYAGRDVAVAQLLGDQGVQLHALAVTKGGAPVHPLYQRGDAVPLPWPASGKTPPGVR